jgi:SPX domain protein involved in polyphosphate accumulation
LKTSILRHLPVLVYTPKSQKIAEGNQQDPTLTSLYFDSPNFSLYNGKIEKGSGTSSLRLRWYGQLKEKPDLILEKKTLTEGDDSDEVRFNIKDKYVMPFIKGEYKMEKAISKLREKGADEEEVENLEKSVADIQEFILESGLQPVLRACYTRTAFQIPGQDKVRISLDTNMTFVREDCLDPDRPCRDPEEWHRLDIDEQEQERQFSSVRKGEISKFPYALLEIKVRESGKKRHPEWIDEIMASHLVREAPRFSKFLHGIASLFEDYINSFPFWMSLMETDIRKDPEQAFEEEQEKKMKQAEDEMAIGSFLGSKPKSLPQFDTFGSPSRKSLKPEPSTSRNGEPHSFKATSIKQQDPAATEEDTEPEYLGASSRLLQIFPTFSTSKYAQAKRNKVQLPPGVKAPEFYLKDVGPVRVEPKVWLANQR